MTIVAKIEAAAQRLERAREIVEHGAIWPIHQDDARRFVAKSHSGQHGENGVPKLYLVGPNGCTCADYRKLAEENGGWCKHRLARELLLAEGSKAEGREKKDGETPAPDNASVAAPPRRNKERFEQAQLAAEAEIHSVKQKWGAV